jgi:hypothetical protein
MTEPRRFHLERNVDPTGMSGTGHVADGIRWADGTASVIWLSERPSIAFWYRPGDGMTDAEWVHTHGGQAGTRIVWDDDPTDPTAELAALRQRFTGLQDEMARQQAVHDRTAHLAHTIEAEVRRLATIMRKHHSPYGTTADYARRLIEVLDTALDQALDAALQEANTSRPISQAVAEQVATRMVRIAVTGPVAVDADSWARGVAELVVAEFAAQMRLHVTVDGRPLDADGEQW